MEVSFRKGNSHRHTLIRQLLYLVVTYLFEPTLKRIGCYHTQVADSLEKGTEHEDEYMISEKELIVNKYVLLLLLQTYVLVSRLNSRFVLCV